MAQQTKGLVEESPTGAASPAPAKLILDGKEYELPVPWRSRRHRAVVSR